jgi:hypothetical protein
MKTHVVPIAVVACALLTQLACARHAADSAHVRISTASKSTKQAPPPAPTPGSKEKERERRPPPPAYLFM